MPPSTVAIHSPYDVEAHYSSKRSVNWVGYKAHVTEICDKDTPHFITHVQTTLSTVTVATGLNLCRLNDWLNGIPLAPTRYSGFMTLKRKPS